MRKSTNCHRYLAVEYLLGELLLKSYDGDRRRSLREASRLLDGFLTRLDQYDILSASDKKVYEQFQESPNSFTLAASNNAEERRRVKVARFQEEKALKTRLEVNTLYLPLRWPANRPLVSKE
jgi:immunoglobulin-binding protein 1